MTSSSPQDLALRIAELEAERDALQDRLNFLLGSIKDFAVIMMDMEGRIVSWNAGAERILGYAEPEIIGQKYHLFFTPEDRAVKAPESELRTTEAEGRSTDDRWHVRKDGSRFWASGFVRPYHEKGVIRGFTKVLRDMTQMKLVQDASEQLNRELEQRVLDRTRQLHETNEKLRQQTDQLHQSQKLEAVGRLAGGVAHDFNNLVSGILAITEDLQERMDQNGSDYKDLEEIKRAARKTVGLTKQLLTFSRRQLVEVRVTNLNRIINDIAIMLRRLIGEHIRLDLDLAPDLSNVKADISQIEQIVVNLVVNARDALVKGGVISIKTLPGDSQTRGNALSEAPGGFIVLQVSDNGVGMDPEILRHAFEPFFTTKGKEGSGLGLATVYGIVKQNGGDIHLESAPGKGTTLTIYWPAVKASEDAMQKTILLSPDLLGTETIMLVEDEDIVRRAAAKTLRKRGYTVLEASGPAEALEKAAAHRAPIHLLLTDVIMPHMNGPELAKQLAAAHSETTVLYMSGYSGDIVFERGLLEPGAAFIEKSFGPDSLARKIRLVLNIHKTKV